jgi:hypothetical protein
VLVNQGLKLVLYSKAQRQEMKDARVSLAKEAGADQEVVAIFLAGVVLGFGFGGSPELA